MNIAFFAYDDSLSNSFHAQRSEFPYQTIGFWLLLFLPFLVMPPLAEVTRRVLARRVKSIARSLPDFRLLDYLFLSVVAYAVVIIAMYRADAWHLLWSGADAIAAVRARFELLDRLHFYERAVLQSLLVFLSLYSLVRALKSASPTWFVIAGINLVLMTWLLVTLNMKWPVVVLYGGIVASTALFGRYRLVSSVAASVVMVCVYFFISSALLRMPSTLTPKVPIVVTTENPSARVEKSEPAQAPIVPPAASIEKTVRAAAEASDYLVLGGLVRMAKPYPFYYRTFTDEGTICGTILDRIKRSPVACHPSNLIYERLFGNDGFVGRGTAPAAVNISGYALNGWAGAMLATALASIVIGIFMAVPADLNNMSGTVIVMGILTAYFFSQLPFEGPIVYDHGALWWILLVAVYAVFRVPMRGCPSLPRARS